MPDWRLEYVVCEHVAAWPLDSPPTLPDAKIRHAGFRVCCDSCWDAGFLHHEPLDTHERDDGMCIGSMAEGREVDRG